MKTEVCFILDSDIKTSYKLSLRLTW